MEENKGIIFSRPPRFLPEIPRGELEIPAPPSDEQKPEIQWLSILLPPIVMIMGSMLMATAMGGNALFMYITIATTITTIFVSLVNATSQIKKHKKYIKTRKKKYLQLISDLKTEFQLAKEQQIAGMNEINPSPAVCVERLMKTDSKLWERVPAHRDFLSVRLGIGSIPATLMPKYAKAQLQIDVDPLQEEPEKLGREFELISNLPVCLDLLQSEISGIAGIKGEVNALLRIIALQIITNHCYADAKLVLVIKEEALGQWEWIKQLPHVWDDDYRIRFVMCEPNMAHNTLGVLYEQLKDRELKQNKDNNVKYNFSQYIFIVSNPELLEDEAIGKYLYHGNALLGVTTLFAADCKEYLPMNCKSVVTLQGKVGTYANKDSGQQIKFNVDTIDTKDLEVAARKLAPIKLKKSATQFTLPKSITLLETLGVKRIEEVDLFSHWSQNKTYNGMGVPIGAKAGGELFNLDMQAYETSHGPHGLVAGTTGSGKSELLQSIIISLAVHFHPHDVVFVLIDYKGGGMADVFKGMPHLVGTITNLGGNQTTRALLSIKSELKRRQAIFLAHEVNNIDKYQKLYHSGKAQEPLPHLIMIADEFAELKAEQPDFMQELVSTARVGRSLGVHLILATQKPAGVVDDQIWSNSRFKICLKVQDEADSKDVIKRPDAAMIKEPGRGYIQVGNDEIFEMIQSTFSGADYNPNGQTVKKKKNKLFKVGLDGRTSQVYPLHQEFIEESEKDSQLKAMVEYIITECEKHHIEALKGPWLPPLPETIYLDDVCDETKVEDEILVATMGIQDDPKAQCQDKLTFNFIEEGNLLIYGSAGTGKTTLLETVLMSMAYRYTPKHFNFYILDLGGGSLKKMEYLPHCGGVMGVEDEDKINQFILYIFRMIEERKEAFGRELAANLPAYNQVSSTKFPYVLLVIDNYFALSETFEEIDEKFLVLAREGLKYGIYVMATATSPSLIRYKFSINFKTSITLQLTDEGEYSIVVGRTDGLVPDKVLGRGLIKREYPIEFQTSLPHPKGQTLVEVLKDFASQCDGIEAPPVPQMPEHMSILQLNEVADTKALVIGRNHNDMLPVQIDLASQLAVMVVGDVQTGKSTILMAWIRGMLHKAGGDKVDLYIADSSNMGLFNLTKQLIYKDLNGEDIDSICEELKEIIERRKEQLNAYRKIGEDLDQLYESWNQVVIVIDNINEYVENADYNFKELLQHIIKKCYGLKITMLVAGIESELAGNWDDVVKGIRELQVGVVLGSIKEQDIFNVKVPYGYYEQELTLGDGYLVIRNKYDPIRLACQ